MTSKEYQEQMKLFDIYKKKVSSITRKQPLVCLENFHKRGRIRYHLDHIISIRYGFEHGIPPEVIADIKNLRFIPSKENIKKSSFLERESSEMIQYFIEEGTL